MKRKQKKGDGDFSWPFARRRQTWVEQADKHSAAAAEIYEDALYKKNSESGRAARRAASFYYNAAEYYRRAGLGLAAKNSFESAAECWSLYGDEEAVIHCEKRAGEIDSYWEDEEATDE